MSTVSQQDNVELNKTVKFLTSLGNEETENNTYHVFQNKNIYHLGGNFYIEENVRRFDVINWIETLFIKTCKLKTQRNVIRYQSPNITNHKTIVLTSQ